jgi:hypothetical protein
MQGQSGAGALRLYLLRMRDRADLERAFSVVSETSEISSFTLEPQLRRLRFIAPADPGARLLEKIYLQGGMVWCSTHELGHADVT